MSEQSYTAQGWDRYYPNPERPLQGPLNHVRPRIQRSEMAMREAVDTAAVAICGVGQLRRAIAELEPSDTATLDQMLDLSRAFANGAAISVFYLASGGLIRGVVR